MAKRKDLRIVKRKNGKKWVECKMKELTVGDQFRMWDPDGKIVRDNDNKYVFTVKTEPEYNKHGENVWGVTVE